MYSQAGQKRLHEVPMAANDTRLESLMKRAASGDERAYGELLGESARLLRAYISRRIGVRVDVEDVVQEILVSIHKARHTYDETRPYAPWMFAIARYRLQDHLRSHYTDRLRLAVPLEEAEIIPAADVTFEGNEYESLLGELRHLPDKQAMILTLMHEQGYTAKEVAGRIGMKESAVKVAAHRAYKQLRQKLAGQ
jgi:RNA polymerase sigma-70 factor (ECF subfamily)